jgi:hypothetical protein
MSDFLKFGGRLKAHIFVSALLRRALANGAFAAIAQKGAREAGAVVICVRQNAAHLCLYQAVTNMDGARVWHESGPADEAQTQALLSRLKSRDPDLWIVEIEDKDGRHFITEEVVRAVAI